MTEFLLAIVELVFYSVGTMTAGADSVKSLKTPSLVSLFMHNSLFYIAVCTLTIRIFD